MTTLRKQVRERFGELEPHREYLFGTLGEKVPGYNYLYYAYIPGRGRTVIRNTKSAGVVGQKIVIGYSTYEPEVRQVIGSNFTAGNEPVNNPDVGPHAPSHQWGGSDVLYIDSKQIIPFTIYPSGGLTITVMPGIIMNGDSPVYSYGGDSIDLTDYLPVSGYKFVLVEANTIGEITIKDGTAYALELFGFDKIPAVDVDYSAVGAVRLYAGQTVITNSYADSDIIDLRFVLRSNLVSNFLGLSDTPDSYTGHEYDGVYVNALGTGLEFVSKDGGTGLKALLPVILFDEMAPSLGQATFDWTGDTSDLFMIDIYLQGKSTYAAGNGDPVNIALSGDTTATNYRRQYLTATGATIAGGTDETDRRIVSMASSQTADMSGEAHIRIISPAGGFTKTIFGEYFVRLGASTTELGTRGLNWESYGAIGQITLDLVNGNFAVDTRCVMVGWKEVSLFSVPEHTWFVDGALAAATGVGAAYVSPRAMLIDKVILHVADKGTAGSTVIDVNINGVSALGGVLPTVAYDDADNYDAETYALITVDQYDIITIDIDSVATGAHRATVEVIFK